MSVFSMEFQYHPNVGLVGEATDEFGNRLTKIAGSRVPVFNGGGSDVVSRGHRSVTARGDMLNDKSDQPYRMNRTER